MLNDAEMIIEEVLEFFSKTPPFQFLDEASRRSIAGGVSVEFYPKGFTILAQNGPPSRYLRVVKKGAVKVFMKSPEAEDVVIDYRSEGDSFGFLSLVSDDRSRTNIVAATDTICYLIDRETTLRLMDANPAFTEFFLKSFFTQYIDKTYREMRNRSLLCGGGGDKLLFSTPVGELATRGVVTASRDISIRDAAEVMSRSRISCVVLTDADGVPVGIITDRDLRDKVVSKGRDVSGPVADIMSVSLIRADEREYCFEALLKMVRYGIHHLLIVGDGKLRGIITNHDLMMLQGTSPISVAREIEHQTTIDGLVPAAGKVNKIIALLLKEGARASNITKILTEINDRLLQKILEITEKRLGQPPVPYCWIVYGSEGRREQTFRTDQDNAIIYANCQETEQESRAKAYFAEFALSVRDSLEQCGFPHCPAGYMASNQQWCQPIRVWKKYLSGWISNPTADAVLKSLIFFDFRPVHGDFRLADDLRAHLQSALEAHEIFVGHMANMIVKNSPPVGFFKSFIVDKSGEHKDELNLKVKGIALIVDIVRLFALEKGVDETSTIDRIAALRNRHTIVEEYADELEHAFEFMMLLRIHHQFAQIEAGTEPDNFINPEKLGAMEKKTMREAFGLISRIQDVLIERYKPLIW